MSSDNYTSSSSDSSSDYEELYIPTKSKIFNSFDFNDIEKAVKYNNDWDIGKNMKQYTIIKILNTDSKIYIASGSDGNKYVLKRFKNCTDLPPEGQILQFTKSKHVAKMIDHFIFETNYVIVFPYYNNSIDLFRYLNYRYQNLSFKKFRHPYILFSKYEIKTIIKTLVEFTKDFLKEGILYFDLKADNILCYTTETVKTDAADEKTAIETYLHLKILDLDGCCFFDHTDAENNKNFEIKIYTSGFLPPEAMKKDRIKTINPSRFYSYAIMSVIHFLLTYDTIVYNVKTNTIKTKFKYINLNNDPDLKDLFSKTITINPEHRLTVDEILKHKFFQ